MSFRSTAYTSAEIEWRCGVTLPVRAIEMSPSNPLLARRAGHMLLLRRSGREPELLTDMCWRRSEEYCLAQKRTLNGQLEHERAAARGGAGDRRRTAQTGSNPA